MTKFLADESETHLDRFELIAELASGGMATVYLGRLSGVGGFQRFVAIKRLHPHLANDQEFIQMFLDEARLAARLHHPNVVPIVEIGTTEQGYYLVMEYIEGDTLARLLARSIQAGKPVPFGVGVRIMLDSLAGLQAAHDLTDDDGSPLHIVHRDVSPQNILLGMDGVSRITDFGVARAASRLTTTRSGQLKGKLAYMAPEQARGKAVDHRADVFACGIVAWETMAQKRLFKGEGEAETLNRVLFEPIPNVRSANPNVPAEIDAVIMRALERDIEKRYASCADFADALERAARQANLIASHREVASHILAVIGTDVSQQREALRAWLSRSEPSRQVSAVAKLPQKLGGEASSVSSAVIALQGPAQPVAPAPASSGLSRGLVAALLVAILGLGAMGFALVFRAPAPPVPSVSVNPPAPPPTPTPTPSAITPTTSTTSTTAEPPAVASSTVAAATAAAPVKPHGQKGKNNAVATAKTSAPTATTNAVTAPTTKATLPDENPYR